MFIISKKHVYSNNLIYTLCEADNPLFLENKVSFLELFEIEYFQTSNYI